MRSILLSILLLAPLAAVAQQNPYDSPLIVVKPLGVDQSLRPATPAKPPAPEVPASPTTPPKPTTPEHPPSPFGKLWPKDTLPIFMTRCTQFHTELIKPCLCIINNVMGEMPHDVFMDLNAKGTMESDPRILTIQQKCVADLQNARKRPVGGGGE